jgi:ADP-ribose pyrophosphatase
MKFFEKQIKSETVFQGIIVDVRSDIAQLQTGKHVKREVVVHPGGVGIVPLTDDGKIILVRQYRYPMGEELLEIPAGKLDENETPLECAKRELSEETGCTASELVSLGEIYPSPGFCREVLHLYLALGLKQGEMHLDADELLSVETVSIDKLLDKIMRNELSDAKTIIGILKTKEYLRQSSV